MTELIKKYNVPTPRYTSYPTVPYWEKSPNPDEWARHVVKAFKETNSEDGISVYIHLPYCESLCTYCACNTRITVNHAVEQPYISALLKEWKMYLDLFPAKPKLKELHLGGGTPTFFSPQNLQWLISEIVISAEVTSKSDFSFEAHPASTTIMHLQVLYNLGFRRVSFGVQDFDRKVQVAINRVESFERVKEVIDNARKVGYTSVNIDLVYGLPFQTQQSITETIDLVMSLRPDRIAFYSYAHVPWVKPGQRKFTELDLPVDAEKRKLYEIGRKKFLRFGYVEIGMDHFSLPEEALTLALEEGRIHRNFMGYTHHYTKLLIGLGVSAISDTWTCFAQNIKTVEEYHELINAGKLPITRGHILSKEDLILRKHILNIMCLGKTDWSKKADFTPHINKAVEKLVQAEMDGLVKLREHGLTVTKKGRMFLRNICLAFDARYWKKEPSRQIFSTSA